MGILENHPALVLSAIHDFVGLLNPGFGYISATPTLYIYILEIYIYISYLEVAVLCLLPVKMCRVFTEFLLCA